MTARLSASLRVAASLLALVSLVVPLHARAADSDRPLDDYTVTRFGRRESAPLGVRAIAQDRDGYLWLGSDEGLHRFDGFAFERWTDLSADPLEGSRVRSLHADRRGALWVGFDTGGVSRIEGRRARGFHIREGLVGTSVQSIAEDAGGRLWAGTQRGLYGFDGERWQASPALPDTPVSSVFFDAAGGTWVGSTDVVLHRAAASARFAPVASVQAQTPGVRSLCVHASGRVLATDPVQGFRVVGPRPPLAVPAEQAEQAEQAVGIDVHCASDGTVWVGTASRGLWRVWPHAFGPPATARRAPIATTLLAEGALSVAEDRDHNIWIGTTDGVYRLTPRPLTMIRNIGGATHVMSDANGAMWVATVDGLLRYTRSGQAWAQAARYLPGVRVRLLHADASGTKWIATTRGIFRLAADGEISAPRWQAALDRVESITSDSSGAIWFYDAAGLFRLAGGQLSAVPLPDDVRGVSGGIVHADRHDRLWLITRRGFLELTREGGVKRRYTAADGLPSAGFGHLFVDGRGAFWMEGPAGLTRFAAGRFETLFIEPGPPRYGINAIVKDANGRLWLGGADGSVRRIDEASFDAALARSDRSRGAAATVFDDLPRISGRVNGAVRSAAGDIWFVTDEGVAIVDPLRIEARPRAIDTRIAAVTVDGAPLALDAASLPSGAARIRIDFSALDPTASHRVRFRYRLDNFDDDWIDPGGRRSADYTSLGPGTYAFRVMAAHDGRWSGAAASWTFTIQRRFYQTTAFAGAALLALGGSIYGAWHLRLTIVRRRFAVVLSERMRVSREIHDTLLQSFAAMTLELQALAHTIDVVPIRQKILGLRRRVDEQIEEAREAIWHLRSPLLERYTLPEALRRAGESATGGTPVRFELHYTGSPDACPSRVERELLLVAQEGISNAVRHGRPTRVRVDLGACDDGVRLAIVDDGCGFNPAHALSVAGHCGLIAMRERIEGIGGRFAITSGAGAGTRVEAMVPLASSA